MAIDERLVKALHVEVLRRRQRKPYRPLVEVVQDQHVFDFTDVEGTLVGFRFPDYAQGVEVPGYHMHFISADRTRGGHVLDCRVRHGTALIDGSSGLHIEVPPGVDLGGSGTVAASPEAVERVERGGPPPAREHSPGV